MPEHVRAIVAAVAALLSPFVPLGAAAQAVLPPAEYRALVADANGADQGRAPGRYTLGGASLSLLDFPQATAIGRADGGVLGAGFEGAISYWFTVDGPTSVFDVVPLWVSFALQARVTGGGPANASAAFSLGFAHSGDFQTSVGADLAHPDPADLIETRAFGLQAGQRASISLGVAGASFAGSTAYALADPYIFIDPTFLASHAGYSVRVSSGVGNEMPVTPVTPVPEPGTWALMLAGIGILGTIARRRPR